MENLAHLFPGERSVPDGVHVTVEVTTVYTVERVICGMLVASSKTTDKELAARIAEDYERIRPPFASPEETPGG